MRVYLAGPITGLNFKEATNWRRQTARVIQSLGHAAVSPMRGKDYLKQEDEILSDYEDDHPMSTAKGIYGRDSFDVQHCNVLFVNLVGAEKVSIGTVMEIQMGRCYGKYVLLCMEEGNVHDHPFVTEAASIIVRSVEEGIGILKHLLKEA